MPKGPNGQKRPTDLNQRALAIVRIASGEDAPDPKTPPRGQKGGKAGGRARKDSLSPERRIEIAKSGADKRWNKKGS